MPLREGTRSSNPARTAAADRAGRDTDGGSERMAATPARRSPVGPDSPPLAPVSGPRRAGLRHASSPGSEWQEETQHHEASTAAQLGPRDARSRGGGGPRT